MREINISEVTTAVALAMSPSRRATLHILSGQDGKNRHIFPLQASRAPWVAPSIAGHKLGHPGQPHPGSEPTVCLLQIDAASLIAASVMAAPCALAMSKLVYPEVEESKFKGKESVRIASG